MFQNIGNNISKVFAGILLLMLISSFAFFGVGDIFRGRVSDVAATVGGSKISNIELERAVRREIQRLQGIFGQEAGEEMAENMGVRKHTLDVLINRRILELEAKRLGIIVGEDQVINLIRANGKFNKPSGEFDKNAFSAFLRSVGESESSFVENLKKDISVDVLVGSITNVPKIPGEEIERLYKFEGEKRQGKLLVIPADHIKQVDDPSNTELISYYDEHKALFSAPEYRDISYIKFGTKDVAKEIDLSDEVLKEEYEVRKSEFNEPEKRKLQQIFIDSEKKAEEIHALLKEGKEFLQVAKESAAMDEKAVEFGEASKDLLSQGDILSNDIVETVFSLKEGEYSEPKESDLGWHIFKVKKITPGKTRSFEEVKEELKEAITSEKGSEILYEMAGKFQDEMAGGAKLEEISKRMDLELRKINSIGQDGKTIDGAAIDGLPEYGNFLELAFSSEEGIASDLIASPDGLSYFVLRVDGITASRVRALDEVRGLVTNAWKEERKKDELKQFAEKLAQDLREEIKNGKEAALSEKAKELQLTLEDSGLFYRSGGGAIKNLPEEMLEDMFSLSPGLISYAYMNGNGDFVIGMLEKIIPADENDKSFGKTSVENNLQKEFADDIISQYIRYLRSKYPVKYSG